MGLFDDFRRTRQANRVSSGPLRAFLSEPHQSARTPVREARLLAVDFETTGLDPHADQVISVGFIPVDGEDIVFEGAMSMLVRPRGDSDDSSGGVGQSAVIHHLTDEQLENGEDVEDVLDELYSALAGRHLLAHYAGLEIGFLQALTQRIHGVRPRLQAVDTLELQARLVAAGFDDEPDPEELRLWSARERFGLPQTVAHEALSDALACAELFLAQSRELEAGGRLLLKDVLS